MHALNDDNCNPNRLNLYMQGNVIVNDDVKQLTMRSININNFA